MISLNDVLLSASNIPVDDPIAEMWGAMLCGGYTPIVVEYTGSLPITINADGTSLIDYRIYGASGGVGEEVDITGLSEPLCGIQTYTDTLDLSTGILTRKIKKLVLTGEENFSFSNNCFVLWLNSVRYPFPKQEIIYCAHYKGRTPTYRDSLNNCQCMITINQNQIAIKDISYSTEYDFKSYLTTQYAAGTPVTIWYVLENPDISTISIPPGLTGTIEGYLIQDGTPMPETPIYPTANGVKQADGTYSIEYGYKLPMTVQSANLFDPNVHTDVPVYIGDTPLGEDEYVDYGEQKVYHKNPANYFDGYFELGAIDHNTGADVPSNSSIRTDFIELEPSNRYYIKWKTENLYILLASYDENKNYVRYLGARTGNPSYFELGADEKYIRFYLYNKATPPKEMMICKNADAPYYDPQDPPVPFPEIPTIDGTTVIDCELETKPDEMYVKYIQGGR